MSRTHPGKLKVASLSFAMQCLHLLQFHVLIMEIIYTNMHSALKNFKTVSNIYSYGTMKLNLNLLN